MRRRTNVTVLVVCEGDAEAELVRDIQSLYLSRFCGTSLSNGRMHTATAAAERLISRIS
jgi:hypothetical protein